MTTTTTQAPPTADGEYVFFHSGEGPTYRKVNNEDTGKGAFTRIPTIDISNVGSTDQKEHKKIAKELFQACTTSGFFYLSNHGIPNELLDQTFRTLERFFALNHETKMTAHVQKNPAIRGYEPMLETRLDPRTKGDLKEAFTMGDCVIEPEQDYRRRTGEDPPPHITQPQNIWPEQAPWFREGLYKYYTAVFPLAMRLVRMFALAFDLEETAFDRYFRFPITGMRPLHYPPMSVDAGENAVGLGAHSDFTWLTMVLQDDVPALEILNKNGTWMDAPPQKNTLVCNVGQFLERQTNGRFVATVHRVRNKTGERRFSLPFFLTPDPDTTLPILDCCVEPGKDPEFEPVNTGDLYIRRVLPVRPKHPTSVKYKDVPKDQLKYEILYA